ncbi:MAG: glycosyltransferase [Acidobacteriota bacterium]
MSHIAFVIPGLDRIGGAERQVIALAAGLSRRGWTVTTIVLTGDGGAAREALRAMGVDFVSLRMRKGLGDPRGWWRMHGWLRTNRPDVVHAHLPHAIFLARWSRLAAAVPVVVDTVHTSRTAAGGQRLGFRISRFLSDCSTAVSGSAARAWIGDGLISAAKSLVLPNGIDVDRWKPDAEARARMRAELGVGDGFVWLAAGRLEAVKNPAALLDAMALLPPSSRLYIAGSGPLEQALREQAAALELTERVQFLGFVQDLLPWMQAADGVALASRWEGLPLVLLEAAACGLPAVATDVAGSRDAIVEGKTGYLCTPGDAAALAAAMQHIERMREEDRAAMGARAQAHAQSAFSLTKILDQWEAVYRNLLLHRMQATHWARRIALLPIEGGGAESPLAPAPAPASAAEME